MNLTLNEKTYGALMVLSTTLDSLLPVAFEHWHRHETSLPKVTPHSMFFQNQQVQSYGMQAVLHLNSKSFTQAIGKPAHLEMLSSP